MNEPDRWRSPDAINERDDIPTECIKRKHDLVNLKNFGKSTFSTSEDSLKKKKNDIDIMIEKKLPQTMNDPLIVTDGELQPSVNSVMYRENLSRSKNDGIDDDGAAFSENILPHVVQHMPADMNEKKTKLLHSQSDTTNATSLPSLPNFCTYKNIRIHQPAPRHVIRTISDCADFHLKVEKINFFGIPVTTNHKKRTEVKPFNFQSRMKASQQQQQQQLQNSCKTATIPRKSTFLFNEQTLKTSLRPSRNNGKMSIPHNMSSNAVVSRKLCPVISKINALKLNSPEKNVTMTTLKFKVSKSVTNVNKENSIPNNKLVGSRESMHATVEPKAKADQKLKFKAKMKAREIELEKMRADIAQRRRNEVKLKGKAL